MHMKKCPKCKADIQENARFCLYCMTSFEEKQVIEAPKADHKRLLLVVVAVSACILLALSTFLFTSKENASNEFGNTTSSSSDNSASHTFSTNQSTTSSKTANSEPRSTSKGEGLAVNTPTATTTVSTAATVSTTTGRKTNKASDTQAITSTTTTTTASSVLNTVTYLYRDAQYGDDFSVSANLENCVVIIGVTGTATNGEYEIPETINNKKVIAVAALAFCDDSISQTVKTVVIPSSVKTIWNNAFANCYNLTDIYFKGNAVYTESKAFADSSKRNGTLTIHCSATCHDRNFRYYKNSASSYDAEFKEWNG